MKLWIDAARGSAENVFGLGLIERHLRAISHLKITLSEVIIDTGGAGPVPWRNDMRLGCEVRLVSGSGTAGERLRRAMAGGEVLLATDAATLADGRLYPFLAGRQGSATVRQGMAALARVEPGDIEKLLPAQTVEAAVARLPEVTQEEFPAFVAKLRRSLPFYLFSVTSEHERRSAERFLFWSNYKGSTDFFTKYVYPPLVWMLVPPLARAHVHPNVVTLVSIVLTVLAVPLFGTGHFWWGFACAYGMSVLDSVDGKLARLTFTDSAIGNVLDHGLDIVHPPFWYFGWAAGLLGGWAMVDAGQALWRAAWLMLVLYVLDRLVLSVYRTKYRRGLHTHAPIDAFLRTFISRRNINLPLFTVAYSLGMGVWAFYAVVVWQAVTCCYHAGRTIWILAFQGDDPRTA